MNTFYIYTMKLDEYQQLMDDDFISDETRQIKLNNHLLVSGTNRRIITELLRLNGLHELVQGESDVNVFDSHVFGMKYNQLQSLVQDEVRMAAGHFSHTIHRVNLAAFYYLSFHVERELTVVLLKNELPDGAIERGNWEGVPPTPAPTYSRFYDSDLPE